MGKPKQDDVHEDTLDEALEDSFPASDPPSMTQPRSKAGAPANKKTPEGEVKARAKEEDTASKERTPAKKG